ncbi:MAG: tetratricopeptide repeat protein [Gemmatimonadales bacterium]|jgi:serine/threonine-protein kinase
MSDSGSGLRLFLGELKRRRVYRVAVVYAVVAFVVWQAAEIAFPALNLPDWTLTFVVVATLLGFPIALVLAWAFDITPHGVRRAGSLAAGRGTGAVAMAGLALLVLALGAGWYVLWGTGSEPDRKSIAVLPLDNLSGDEGTEPFVAGIHDDILTHLYKIADLKVISRTSVMEYRDTRKNLRQIADELGVATVLEGGVQRAGDRVRINVQLIDARTDEHIWAEDYDRELTTENIFAVQSDVALQVAAALQSVLSPAEQAQIESRPTQNLEAYELYLRGNDYDRQSEELQDQLTAVRLWRRSTELDPSFALPYAKLVGAHCLMHFGLADRSEDHVGQAAAAAARLRELAPDLGETHLALGNYYYHCLGDYNRALDEFAHALATQPNNSKVYSGLAGVYRRQGRWDEAIVGWAKASELDPLYYGWPEELAYTYTCLREYAKADSLWERVAALAPDIPSHPFRAANRLSWTGDTRAARSIVEPALRLAGSTEDPYLIYDLFLIELCEGDYGKALSWLSSMSSPALESHFWVRTRAQLAARAYALQGEAALARAYYDSARVYLEARIQERPDDERLHASLGIARAGLGRDQTAVQAAQRAVDLMPLSADALRGPEALLALARVYTMIGDYGAAVEQLDTLLSIPSEISVPLLRIDPAWDPLRDDARFQALLERHGS